MEMRDKKLVVIGGAGFIGSHITEQLLAEDPREVVVFDNLTRGTKENLEKVLDDPRVTLWEGDITHQDVLHAALEGADGVFHLAALWLLHCYEYPRAAFQVNAEGTFNVLDACVKQQVKRLVFSSSASVYGNALVTPMTEEHPFNNRTFYGATKIAGEQMARAYHERYGLDYVGMRYMNVYGPRQDYHSAYTSVIMKMLDRLDEHQSPKVFGDGSQTFDFIYVEDVARSNICAMKAESTDTFYNVGSGEGTTIKQVAELLLEITGAEQQIEYVPADVEFVTHRIGSTELAEQDLGFKTTIDLRDGMRRLIEWRNARHDTRTYAL